MTVDLGDIYQLAYDHYVNGSLATAGAATWTVTLPDGTTTAPITATTTGTGLYRNDYAPTVAGRHLWRWVGTGANAGAQTGAFNVRSPAPLDLISLVAAKRALNIAPTSVADDEELRAAIEAVTAVVEGPHGVGHAVVRRAVTERHDLRGRAVDRLVLHEHPVIALTTVESLGSAAHTWTLADLDVDPGPGVVTVLAGRWLSGLLRVTYTAGYEAIPANLTEAAEMILQDHWATQRGNRGGPKFAGQRDDEFAAADPPLISRRARALLGHTWVGIA